MDGVKPPPRVAEQLPVCRGLPSVRGFLSNKLSCLLSDLNETWQEGTFGTAAQNGFVVFGFGHQRAKLFNTESENFGLLAILRYFVASRRGQKAQRDD